MALITVQIDLETVQQLIAEKEERIVQLDGEMTTLQNEIDRLRAAITGNPVQPPDLFTPVKTATGRLKKGESLKLIENYFISNKGRGAISIKDLVTYTGIPYGTAHRICTNLKEDGKVREINGKWSAV